MKPPAKRVRQVFLVESRERYKTGRWSHWEIDYGVGMFNRRLDAFETAAELNGGSIKLQYRMAHYIPVELLRRERKGKK